MSDYFKHFPTIEYGRFLAKNITVNVRMDPKTKNNSLLYHKYAMREGDNYRTIAGKYYDAEELDWLIYFANDVIDPYYDVYLDQSSFENYIIQKYGSIERAQQLTAAWINDWRNDDSDIPVGTYNALLPSIKRYYDPQLDQYRNVTHYKRSRIDMRTNTNRIIRWLLSGVLGGSTRDLIDVYASGNKIGTCELVSEDGKTVTCQHLILTDDAEPTHLAFWNEDALISIDEVVMDHEAIPSTEITFWKDVSCYDAEVTANEAKKEIKLVSNQFSGELKRQLKDKLR